MVFSSAVFLFVFLPLVFLLYQAIPGIPGRNLMLALASLVFYAFGQLVYLPLFFCSILLNYLAGLALIRMRENRRLLLTLALLLNLAVLALFKYTDFMIGTVNSLLGTSLALTGIVLPIGISFFTFQGLSYVIDVYRDKSSGTEDFVKLWLYISFFPQLIAGPIVKYHDIAPQLDSRQVGWEELSLGIRRFILGLAKKLLLANPIGLIADRVFQDLLLQWGASLDWRLAWLGAVCYTLQIYFDFSGYSDMAIGLGRMFGFHFAENFRLPYSALSLRDFWRRWHISLSSWFKEYLYIPLGGNRRGRLRSALNKLLVFFCTGLWHGANWTFVVWGLGHGLLSSLEGAGLIPVEKLRRSAPGRLFLRIYTLLSVTLLFVLFRADTLSDGFTLIRAMFSGPWSAEGSYQFCSLLSPAALLNLSLALIASLGIFSRLWERIPRGGVRSVLSMLLSLVLFLLSVLSLSRGGFNPFIYFQF